MIVMRVIVIAVRAQGCRRNGLPHAVTSRVGAAVTGLSDVEESPDRGAVGLAGGGVVGFGAAFDFGTQFGIRDGFGRGGIHELKQVLAVIATALRMIYG